MLNVGPADCTGGQMQIAQRVSIPGAVSALIEAHSPAAHPLRSFSDPLRSLPYIGFSQAGDFGDFLGWIILQKVRHGIPAFGVGLNENRIGMSVFHQQIQQTVKKSQIGAGPDLQKQISLVRLSP